MARPANDPAERPGLEFVFVVSGKKHRKPESWCAWIVEKRDWNAKMVAPTRLLRRRFWAASLFATGRCRTGDERGVTGRAARVRNHSIGSPAASVKRTRCTTLS